MKKAADVVVIGGGVIGLACAWRLLKKGLRVTLLSHAVPGASAASLGVLAPSSPRVSSNFHRLHRLSLEMFAHFVQEVEEDSGAAVPYRRCGGLEVILSETQRRQALDEVDAVAAQNWEWNGLPAMTLLSPREARELEPDVDTGDYGALYTRVTAQVSPGEFLQALRKACIVRGADMKDECPVQAIEINRGRAVGVYTQDGFLPSGNIVVCAGVWSSHLHALLEEYCLVKPVRGQALLVEAKELLIRHIVRRGGFYLVPQPGNLIALGSTTERESGFSAEATPGGIQEVLEGTSGVLRGFENPTITKKWAGLRPASRDGRPYIGPVPGASGLFAATGHYKIGFSYAPVTAKIMGDLLADGKTNLDLSELLPRKAGKRGRHG